MEHFDFISMHGAWPSSWLDNGWEEYLINDEYVKITGTVLLDYGSRNNNGGYLVIYGDDRVLFTSDTMKAGANPQDFEVDIRGIEKLKVEFITGDDYWGIANVMLHH